MIHSVNGFNDILSHLDKINSLKIKIQQGEVLVVRKAYPAEPLTKIRGYLQSVGGDSLPQYQPIEKGAPNFHRVNQKDPRSYVEGCFHQFVFYPWNQDIFDVFGTFREIFQLKNLLSGLDADAFLSQEPERGCTSRVAFQFYPKGQGFLAPHTDPVDYHQLAVPTLILSKKGRDFQEGGIFVSLNGKETDIDDVCDIGDVVYFNAQSIHGVKMIDPSKEKNWLDFQGRWMGLFPINKLSSNTDISNSETIV